MHYKYIYIQDTLLTIYWQVNLYQARIIQTTILIIKLNLKEIIILEIKSYFIKNLLRVIQND